MNDRPVPSPPEPMPARSPPPPAVDPRRRWWLLGTLMIGTIASIMSSTIVNVGIPDMSRYFGVGQERAQWVSTSFMAASTLSMLTTPWLLGRLGYRRCFITAVLVLLIGGLVGGLATSYGWVLAMRAIEGLAAGVLQPIPAIVIMRAFAASERGKAMGIFGMGVVLAPALGPTVGGVLVHAFGWRSIFFVVIPFCLAAMALAMRHVPKAGPGGLPANARPVRFDFAGLGLLAVALLALMNGLVMLHGAGPGELPAGGLGLLAIAGVGALAFVIHQHRASQPLLNLGLFRQRQFASGSLVAFTYGIALFGSTYLVPIFLQIALEMTPTEAGAALLPAGIVLGVVIPIAGRMADHLPLHRLLVFGLVLLAFSFATMLGVGPTTTLATVMVLTLIGRIGLGFVLPSLNVGAVRSIDPALIPQGTSAINFVRQLGGAVGVNLIGIILEWRLAAHGAANLATATTAQKLPAFHECFGLVALITTAAIAAAFGMREPARPAG